MRFGRPREHYWSQLDPEVKELCEAAVASLVTHGATVEEVSLPSLPAAVDAANLVALVEATEEFIPKPGGSPRAALRMARM